MRQQFLCCICAIGVPIVEPVYLPVQGRSEGGPCKGGNDQYQQHSQVVFLSKVIEVIKYEGLISALLPSNAVNVEEAVDDLSGGQ